MRRRLLPKIQCPHCWHKFLAEDVLWVATDPDLLGDPIVGDDAPARFLPTRYAPSGEALDRRGSPCRDLACPNCHLSIAPVILEHVSRIISIVGTPGCGKSYFLTSSIWHLRQAMARSFALAVSDADPVGNRAITEQEQQLFLQDDPHRLVYLEKTQLEGSRYDSVQFEPGRVTLLPQPYLFTIRPTKQHVNARGANQLTELLCLYDNAGEHFMPGSESALSPTTQHLGQSKNVMFVFDPSQDVRFRAKLRGASNDPQIQSQSRLFRQDTVLLEVASRIRRHSGMPAGAKLTQSLTVVVSKSDIWASLLPREDIRTDPYTSDPRADGCVLGRIDKDRVEHVSERIEALLMETVPEFVSAVNDIAERVLYVPVSATGGSPRVEQSSGMMKIEAGQIRPWWVTVPFVYEFSRWGKIIGSTRSRDSVENSAKE
ncbi:MAG: hypothetical protein EXS03_07775 [Phycisphaerales bacterium]|nr:hypothetical protein [Phycisphaerales bacterium]